MSDIVMAGDPATCAAAAAVALPAGGSRCLLLLLYGLPACGKTSCHVEVCRRARARGWACEVLSVDEAYASLGGGIDFDEASRALLREARRWTLKEAGARAAAAVAGACPCVAARARDVAGGGRRANSRRGLCTHAGCQRSSLWRTTCPSGACGVRTSISHSRVSGAGARARACPIGCRLWC